MYASDQVLDVAGGHPSLSEEELLMQQAVAAYQQQEQARLEYDRAARHFHRVAVKLSREGGEQARADFVRCTGEIRREILLRREHLGLSDVTR